MPIHSFSFRVLPTSTSRLEGEIIFILVTRRSMISMGRSNSSTMQMGMAPPQGCRAGERGGKAGWQAAEDARGGMPRGERCGMLWC